MSHDVTIKKQYLSITALERALSKFGWTLERDATYQAYGSNTKKNQPLVAKNPDDGYDINILENVREDGKVEYKLVLDWYDGSIQRQLGAHGENVSKLDQEYAYQTIQETAENEFEFASTHREVLSNGKVMVTVEY